MENFRIRIWIRVENFRIRIRLPVIIRTNPHHCFMVTFQVWFWLFGNNFFCNLLKLGSGPEGRTEIKCYALQVSLFLGGLWLQCQIQGNKKRILSLITMFDRYLFFKIIQILQQTLHTHINEHHHGIRRKQRQDEGGKKVSRSSNHTFILFLIRDVRISVWPDNQVFLCRISRKICSYIFINRNQKLS